MPPVPKHDDLIYDVGLHKGEDTDYYLKKGFRVIAFEANPELVAECQKQFSTDIASGRLVIVPGAIVAAAAVGASTTVPFYRSRLHSVWGTTDPNWAQRNQALGAANEVIEVPRVNFAACIRTHGIPYYMKIDIEGADLVCLESLLEFDDRPSFVSVESEKTSFDRLRDELNLLERLGYQQFTAVQQENIESKVSPNPSRERNSINYQFQPGASGVFGNDLQTAWKTRQQIEKQYSRIFREYRLFGDYSYLRGYAWGRKLIGLLRRIARRPLPGWYDTHARLSQGP